MVRAKRRDEWDRAGMLLALIHNRTDFSDKPSVKQPTDFWPDGLLTDREKQPAADAKPAYQKTTLGSILTRMFPEKQQRGE